MRSLRRIGAWMIALGPLALAESGWAQFPLSPGKIVVTCASSVAPPGYVAAVFDVNNPPLPTSPPTNWPAPVFHDSSWTNVTLGQIGGGTGDRDEVFGIALDDAIPPNIYLTSTSAYRKNLLGFLASGTGKVYKIDGTSGALTQFAKLPNCASPSCPGSGNPGLGNIAFDRDHSQFFVTNHFDGKIYRLSMSGATLETFDPFAPFNLGLNVNGFVPLAERTWGVGVLRNRVYFGTWSEDGRTGSPANPNRVYSIPLTSTGAFVPSATATLEVTLPPRIPGLPAQTRPIADIEFSNDGRMLIAERTMAGDDVVSAHQSRVLEFVGGQGAWSASPRTFGIGIGGPGAANSAGGVDYACVDGSPERVVAMGDALQLSSPNNALYGVQILDATGGDVNSSVLVDLDNETTNQDKSILGDVDALSNCSRCLDLVDLEILCEATNQITYTLNFKVKNNSGVTATQLFLVDLPSGLTATPNSWSLPGGLAPGATSGVLTATITGGLPGMTVPFRLSLHDASLAECCAVEQTIELPNCGCAQLVSGRVTCGPGSGFTYDYTVRNLTGDPVEYVLFASHTPNLTIGQPGLPIPTVSPGGTYQGQVTFSGPGAIPGQWSCFTLSLHDGALNECCSIDKCVDLPRCGASNGVRDLATGRSDDPAGGVLRDASWKLVNAAGKKPAMVVGSRPSRWPSPLSGSAWISADPAQGASRPGVAGLEFERCFCLGAGANAVDLELSLLADDRASVFLNGTKLGGPAGAARRGRPLHLQRAGAVGDGLFRRGDNCLRIKVPDRERGSVGLDLAGTLTAPGGACPNR